MVQCVNSIPALASRDHLTSRRLWQERQEPHILSDGSLPAVATTHDTGYDLSVGNLVIKLVSTLEKVCVDEFICTSRGKADICLARQMAMYLMHTVFSCPYHRVAAFFGRDRTTISYACRLIEDARDDRDFDRRLEVMENLLVSARTLCEVAEGGSNEQ